ncbi:hypothetical protein EVAR_87792_1 [Eumeta japonica]|uniref:Uncharacterized protein n=1 Tax=Eumeta variegata TaxID=151549 RepID=A0A4C1X786_EUMVA|nr:hypothetical protein EVAR_87792_1 [Eumeta japonica]
MGCPMEGRVGRNSLTGRNLQRKRLLTTVFCESVSVLSAKPANFRAPAKFAKPAKIMCVGVCMCVRACAWARARVCVCVCVCVCVRVCVSPWMQKKGSKADIVPLWPAGGDDVRRLHFYKPRAPRPRGLLRRAATSMFRRLRPFVYVVIGISENRTQWFEGDHLPRLISDFIKDVSDDNEDDEQNDRDDEQNDRDDEQNDRDDERYHYGNDSDDETDEL